MEIDTFWDVIEAAQAGAAETGEPFDEVLVKQLADRPRQEILEYAERFDELHDALYRWDVWAAAYLIGGGCSDDSFMDFRAGVIGLGCQWYQRMATDPDSLAAHPDVVQAANLRDRSEVLFYGDVNYAASGAFERITGDADAFYEAWHTFRGADTEGDNAVDMGEDFDFDDDRKMSRTPSLSWPVCCTTPRGVRSGSVSALTRTRHAAITPVVSFGCASSRRRQSGKYSAVTPGRGKRSMRAYAS
ncbi:DUF4240 domain-containing protein [Streptomyces sp. NPDC000348]|uniref:DUF4240 domain-containing protein n=1 Tax=Streptomyces sp. NPDC000348 TaxID=3364538 RepID=UPI0036798CE3